MPGPSPNESLWSPSDMVDDDVVEVKTLRQRLVKPAAIGGVAVVAGAAALAVVAFLVRRFRNK